MEVRGDEKILDKRMPEMKTMIELVDVSNKNLFKGSILDGRILEEETRTEVVDISDKKSTKGRVLDKKILREPEMELEMENKYKYQMWYDRKYKSYLAYNLFY